jgi:cytochrome c
MRCVLLLFALAAAPMASSAATRPKTFDPAIERGQNLAQSRCIQCHAVRPGHQSAHGDAPPFTVLRLRYNEISLSRRIAVVTRGEHFGMPPTPLTDADRHDLVSYIESLESEAP